MSEVVFPEVEKRPLVMCHQEVEHDERGHYIALVYAGEEVLEVIDWMSISVGHQNHIEYDEVIRSIQHMAYVHSDEEYLQIKVVKLIAEREFIKGVPMEKLIKEAENPEGGK